ncbi:unnamed protein product [Cercopithifilaria johnstoni]|uniref:Uncharacterized protein n=1 Tax=Cercopithifilaria johnstoni TaxID=2874296 RepID=A0A8J2PXS7_9BILA|nr:unnamed protein product [Cercopithifilaria johnstoni]
MSEQSSIPSRGTYHTTEQREQASQQQAFRQLLQRIRLVNGQNASALAELITARFSNPAVYRETMEDVLTEGVHELLVPSSSSSSSSSSSTSIQQPHLPPIFQQTQQRMQASQQRYSDGNQYVIQLPVQTNQQSFGVSQQAHAGQLFLQVPLQQLYVVNPGNANPQMFLQVPQLQANSNIPPLESSIESQQSHLQRAESLFLQPSQQSVQNVQQQNPQGNHLLTELSQQTNQHLQSQQSLNGSQSQQQHIQGIQHSLPQLSQQIPILSLQQPFQQTQPLFVQVLQQSSAIPQQSYPQQNQHPLLQVPQQPVQSLQQPLVQQSTQVFQQSNQTTPSFLLGLPQESAQIVQQIQSNQRSTSFEESASRIFQQMLRQISRQSMLESRETNSGSSESTSLPAQVTQMTQQQSNQQQMNQQLQAQTVPRTQLINRESVGVPSGISHASVSQSQPRQQSSETVQRPLEIPDVSLFSLPLEHFMRVIQQCPYRPSDQASSMQSNRQLHLRSFIQSHQESSTQLIRESFVQSSQQSSSLRQELSTQLPQSLSSEDHIQVLPPEVAASSNHSSTAAVLNDRVNAPTVITNINELREIVPEDSRDDEVFIDDEGNDNSLSETNTSSIIAVSRPRNSSESQETITDNESGIPESNNIASLLRNQFLNLDEINRLLESATNDDDDEAVELRDEFDQIFHGDILVAQEMANYLADQLAKIES